MFDTLVANAFSMDTGRFRNPSLSRLSNFFAATNRVQTKSSMSASRTLFSSKLAACSKSTIFLDICLCLCHAAPKWPRPGEESWPLRLLRALMNPCCKALPMFCQSPVYNCHYVQLPPLRIIRYWSIRSVHQFFLSRRTGLKYHALKWKPSDCVQCGCMQCTT